MMEENLDVEMAQSYSETDSYRSWIPIGNLKEIYIYPLDFGKGFKILEAYCSKEGLQSWKLQYKKKKKEAEGGNTRYFDRVFVPIKPYDGELLDISSLPKIDNISQFHKMQEKANKITSKTWQPWRSKFTYLGEEMIANDIDFDITQDNLGYLGEINFIPQKERSKFISQARSKFEIDDFRKFISNFYAYTMINLTSLDGLPQPKEMYENMFIEESRAHFGIKTRKKYNFKEFAELRIGNNVRLSNIVLLKPEFVISFDVLTPGKVSKDDIIWAKAKTDEEMLACSSNMEE